MIDSPLGEYLDTAAELGPLAKSDSCASVNGLDDKSWTHLVVMQSEVREIMLENVVVVVFSVDIARLLEQEDILEVLEFEKPP